MTRISSWRTIGAVVGVTFVLVLAVLAWRVSRGADPALAATRVRAQPTVAASQPPDDRDAWPGGGPPQGPPSGGFSPGGPATGGASVPQTHAS